ncbi:MAG: hypothetical protein AAF311_08735 [Pseudomonadota bacterium]
MKPLFAAILGLAILPQTALADGFDRCELVVVKEVVDADGGRMTVASYQPANGFIGAARQDARSVSLDHEGDPIRGVICTRNDLVPTEADYALLATGVPLSLSQDFDSADSDILTLYFDEDRFAHRYTSDFPMSGEFKDALESRLSDFSARDHGLVKPVTAPNGD